MRKRHLALAAMFTAATAGCQGIGGLVGGGRIQVGGSGSSNLIGGIGSALVDLKFSQLTSAAPLSAYRTQQVTNATSSYGGADLTIDDYQEAITQIVLHTATDSAQLYKGGDLLDLGSGAASISAVISQNAINVPPGTYTSVEVQMGPTVVVKGHATIGSTTFFTRTSTDSPTTTGPEEPYSYVTQGRGSSTMALGAPLVLKAGDHVSLSLQYDTTGAVDLLYSPNWSRYSVPGEYADGTFLQLKYFPLFAFVGSKQPTEQDYDVRVDDPSGLVEGDDQTHWHFHLVMFVDPDSKQVLSVNSIGLLDPGYTGYGPMNTGAMTMINQGATQSYDAATNTYDLAGNLENSAGSARPFNWELPKFQPATHDGTALYFSPRLGMTQAATLSYHADRTL